MKNFILRAAFGLGLIFLINTYLAYQDISLSVGLNGVSFFTSGILGLPGVGLLYGILLYRNL